MAIRRICMVGLLVERSLRPIAGADDWSVSLLRPDCRRTAIQVSKGTPMLASCRNGLECFALQTYTRQFGSNSGMQADFFWGEPDRSAMGTCHALTSVSAERVASAGLRQVCVTVVLRSRDLQGRRTVSYSVVSTHE